MVECTFRADTGDSLAWVDTAVIYLYADTHVLSVGIGTKPDHYWITFATALGGAPGDKSWICPEHSEVVWDKDGCSKCIKDLGFVQLKKFGRWFNTLATTSCNPHRQARVFR